MKMSCPVTVELAHLVGLARQVLTHRFSLPYELWSVQGFGMLRYRLADNVRLHVWDESLRRLPNVSDIHDHLQWHFTSVVLAGALTNTRYLVSYDDLNEDTHHEGVVQAGVGGGLDHDTVRTVRLLARPTERYGPGAIYHQVADEVHRTSFADGTVTMVFQARTATDQARIYWPLGTDWVGAEPRQATSDEIDVVGLAGLAQLTKAWP